MTKVNEAIKSIVIIPGSGEFVYDTEVVRDKYGTPVNSHFDDGKSDAQHTIDSLSINFPNLKQVSIVVGWFADSTDAGSLTISPRVENNETFEGDKWNVGSYTREGTQSTTNWGGSPADKSIIDLVKTLTDKGIEVTIYPMLFVDDDDKSWRGDIKASSDADVDNFFKEYNKFIMHYANMEYDGVKLKDMINNIIVGSEMVDLLRYDDGTNSYKAVDKMIELTGEVKAAVGDNVSTIYAANWDEYGRHPDTNYYYMDKLYAKLDKVGIDAYFRLTDGLTQDQINVDVIKKGWESGIDYDYWLDDNGEKHEIDDPSYAIKNLKWWYANEHINPDGTKTSWVPGAKEVIATEIGFTSVDGTTNNPSAYYSPGTATSAFPDGSTGTPNALAQAIAIEATIEYWNNLHATDSNGIYNKLFQELDWYSYDVRGNFSKLGDGDSADYQYGHWLKEGTLAEVDLVDSIGMS